ncbi:helix-turn-helix domain-containing protein [Aquabacterium sp. A7-Y]|uniref:helix-turn-helix domain-containing protein n=1 Tax=Aquabacterium sp. A7-Y TaxID=1349605 RepID=UPI00223E3772|nr:helix-turn-helix domain-containing protein [Aquabacterium sp. A7-Y]MCW7541849.1 helix-turn-helix domain-containing protein [Aquabacterium sp. A7-Y]
MKHVLLTPIQIGHLLQSARKAAGLSQTELGYRVGLSQSRLSKLELNPGSVTVDQLLALCGSLGLELTLQKRSPPAPASEW